MPFLKIANAPVIDAQLGRGEWEHIKNDVVCHGGTCFLAGRRLRTASKAISGYNPKEWLLSHVTIMASVNTEEGPNKRAQFADYWVTPETAQFINNNGDGWESKLLLHTFKTFLGAENYVEHVQNPVLSKGKIIDAVSRLVPVTHPMTGEPLVDGNGKPVMVVYIDILVATSRRFEELTASIIQGLVDSMSMGCLLKFTICTECGKVIYREKDTCSHILHNKGGQHSALDGMIRATAELCGHHSDPESCEFVEASWVSIPAFKGAKRRNVLQLDEMLISSKIEKAHKVASQRFSSIYKPKKSVQQKLASMNNIVIPHRIVELARA